MTKKGCKDCIDEKGGSGFFQKTGKFIVLFAILGILAIVLTLVTANLAFYLGTDFEITEGSGIYFNFNVFFAFMIGFIVTPIIIIYVSEQRKKVIGK